MKNKAMIVNGLIVILAMIFGPAVIGFAEEDGHHHEAASTDRISLESIKAQPSEGKEGVVELNNELCPISGDKVSGKEAFVHEGVNYQICCQMCVGKFKNNLSKYAHSSAEVKEFMAHQAHS